MDRKDPASGPTIESSPAVPDRSRPIALLTDFGLDGWYVAALKGEILRRAPEATILDISHGVPPQDIAAGAFVLDCVLDSMPIETVFCCVVDPDVGGDRRAICGRIGRWFYAGPDNGLASPLLRRSDREFALHAIEAASFRNPAVSSTFHGRDLFAPAAARLAQGASPGEAGEAVTDPVILAEIHPEADADGITARVMLVDRFGNLVTNLPRAEYDSKLADGAFELRAGSINVANVSQTFASARPNESLAYWGSADTLEIGVNLGSAAAVSGLAAGDAIRIDWREK